MAKKRILVDFHHSTLLQSLIMLFEQRLGYKVYRPIGQDWFNEGYWKINDSAETAAQYLSLDQSFVPKDGTPALNKMVDQDLFDGESPETGVYYCGYPEYGEVNRACTLEFFKNNDFDLVLSSIPQHIEPFKKLAEEAGAKHIFQVGNDWDFELLHGLNVMASTRPRRAPDDVNVIFYHQEFDTQIFRPRRIKPNKKIYSFVNILQNHTQAWDDFQKLELLLERKGFEFATFGGQCRDGNINGPQALADKMAEAMLIFHVKDGGDGFGHIIHNAYSVGRPVIVRSSQYKGKLAQELFAPGTCIDLDTMSIPEAANVIVRLSHSPIQLVRMHTKTSERFRELVNYEVEAERIEQWLQTIT